jgi:beta-lactam-binding protein with PASTA domain
LKGTKKTGFKSPSNKVLNGRFVSMPRIFGLGIRAATKKLEKEGFTVETRYRYSSRVARYNFIGFSPGGGRVPEFSTIYADYSRGEDPAVREARQRAAERRAEKRAEERRAKEKKAEEKKKAEAKKKAEQKKKDQEKKKKGN